MLLTSLSWKCLAPFRHSEDLFRVRSSPSSNTEEGGREEGGRETECDINLLISVTVRGLLMKVK